ncbi:MAG: pyrroline-5-carboxylate reductase [Dehalococcoidales bacterium]|nr:pyrroline-5-carboxylate reductase [Dehalococcoidales bacterium]
MKITFIGGGNMGEAMLAAVLHNHLAIPNDVTVSEPAELRRLYLKEKYKINISADNIPALQNAEIIVLAVKPQILPAVMSELRHRLQPAQLLISIIAGATIPTLKKGLDHAAIIRSMPNTPAQVGEGMTVWTSTPEVSVQQKRTAGEILGAMGKQIYVKEENYIDAATAVSGSGPAYLFYFTEALIEAAVSLGFKPEDATVLAKQTVKGAADLLMQSGQPAQDLRRAVTSPGGTTAAAIKTLEDGQFKELIDKAVKSAYERAKELGK